jgi:ABC-type branched-subunit amino acid transport system permease subunit
VRAFLGNWVALAILVGMLLASAVLGEYWTGFFARCATWMFLAISFTIAYSYAGIPSLAQATIFAVGAYTTVWLAPAFDGDILVLLLVSAALAVFGAFVLGLLLFRMSKNGAAIATIIVSVMGSALGNTAVPVTGGKNGLPLPGVGYHLMLVPVTVGANGTFLLISAALLIVLLGCLWLLTTTHAWTVVRAIQENEKRARVLGYNASAYRLAVFSLSGGIAGIGGCLYALVSRHITTDVLSLLMSFRAILWAVVGGIGTVFGGPVGVLLVQVPAELLSRWTLRVDMIIGLLLILAGLVIPNGLLGLFNANVPTRRRAGSRGIARGRSAADM